MRTQLSSQNAARERWKEGNPRSTLRIPHSRAGFTLLEILVASGVLALMVTILFALFAEGSNAWRMGERTAEVNQGTRTAMELLVREVSQAVIDTNTPPLNLRGLKVDINKSSTANDPASDPTPHGTYGEICFVAPVELGNEITNNVAAPSAYRALCGVRYYVARAVDESGKRSVLGNLTRAAYQTVNRGSPASFYDDPVSLGSGLVRMNSAVVAENVLCFRVHPAQNDTAQGLRPLNPQMFKDMDADQSLAIDYNKFSGRNPCFPGVYIGLCVVDSRTASRINELGLNAASKMAGFYATTNWTMVRFENFKP
ncbi:MAG: prepilin-type N-terminal cleavage/methylation domain-containing protein [Verrucomicrobia bacterium]|nr:prepilin-type N-terminal cleavage/methylation domain-containing protein [Verrucomicrobiota bacterium]